MGRPPKDRQPPFRIGEAPNVLDVDLDDDEAPSEQASDLWNYDMETAPRDGSEVALRLGMDGADYVVCTWRRSRRVSAFQWKTIEGWSSATTRQMLPDLAPVGWARYDVIDGVKKAG